MQMQLPFFPSSTKLINATLGFYESDGFVYYLHNGSPIYCHHKASVSSYRYICGNLVFNGLCTAAELARALGVNKRNIERYAKSIRDNGTDDYFHKKDRRGQCHKMTSEVLEKAQKSLDSGKSQLATAKELGISESSIRYHLRNGTLKKKKINAIVTDLPALTQGTTPSERNISALSAADIFGIGAEWVQLRAMAARGNLEGAPVIFQPCQSLDNAGVLFVLPALIANGLLSYQDHYQVLSKVYYSLDFTVLLLSFMFLARIKNPEQLKHISSNEFGKLLGIDRVPEVKRLRIRLSDISAQEKAEEWMQHLFQFWLENDQNEGFFFYIDGHVSVYHGENAHLGKKHVSRQRLCLPGTSQFWINDSSGNPYLYVNAPVNEKLQEMLQTEIIPQIKQQMKNHLSLQMLEEDADLPAFTLVFDREGYSPKFFESLWQERIAVITYRKNVKDEWAEDDFQEHTINIDDNQVTMKLCEKEVTLDGVKMREVRRLTESGHQTSVITTNKKLSLILIAIYMFSRWCQENFFRYMRQEYDLDRIYQYAVQQLDDNIKVVNPTHSKLTYEIKKLNEKISRRKAELYEIQQKNCQDDLDNTQKYEYKQAELIEELKALDISKEGLTAKRKEQPYKIALKDMPDHKRYNQLKQERNQFINIIKMICYRAETTLSTLIPNDFKRTENEKRALIKSLIKRKGDIIPDYQNNTLTVKLYTMSTPRENRAIEEMCEILNNTETLFPGTNMKMIFKFATF